VTAAIPTEASVSAFARLLRDAEESEAKGRWRVAREQYELALREGRQPADHCAIARTLRRIARCLVEEGELDGALDALSVAQFVAVQSDDTSGIAHAINLQGIIAKQRGELIEAEHSFRAARTLAWKASDSLLVAMLDQNLGTVANIRGNVVEAKLRYEASLAAYRKLDMPRSIGPLHNNLGMLHTDLGQWREAERHFTQALQSAVTHGDLADQLRTQANRAEMYVTRRRFRKAKRLCLRVIALGSGRDACEGSWLAEAYKYLAVTYRETGDAIASEKCFAKSLELAERREDALLTAEILSEMAVLLHDGGRYQETLAALTRAHALFSKLTAGPDLTNVDRRLRELESRFLEIVRGWGESIESADSYTQGHSQRVAQLATLLARDADLSPESLMWFRMGALLHDVGKLVVPPDVLKKRGALNPQEMEMMRQHPMAGELLVRDAHFPWDVCHMIRHHHERWDGTGYPDGLCGQDIPFTARILCIADVYDALTSERSYREAYEPEIAMSIMRAESGQAFDPVLLEIFLERTLPELRRCRSARPSRPMLALVDDSELQPLSA
jgi:HD-GYP domain-containing protein (c-di-GMP phosphodiesterase class II)